MAEEHTAWVRKQKLRHRQFERNRIGVTTVSLLTLGFQIIHPFKINKQLALGILLSVCIKFLTFSKLEPVQVYLSRVFLYQIWNSSHWQQQHILPNGSWYLQQLTWYNRILTLLHNDFSEHRDSLTDKLYFL